MNIVKTIRLRVGKILLRLLTCWEVRKTKQFSLFSHVLSVSKNAEHNRVKTTSGKKSSYDPHMLGQ